MREASGREAAVHAGVLVPWANTVVEAELHRWSGGAVIWHYARLVPTSRTTALDERFLVGLLDAVPGALAQLSALPLQQVYLACTSAAFTYPELASSAAGRATVSVVSAFDAIAEALAGCGASRVILLTPYPDEVAEAEVRMLSRSGISVTGCASLGLDNGYGGVTRDEVRKLIQKVSEDAVGEAEAIVLSCTGWPTFDVIPELRRCLKKPVISSNLAMALHARHAGSDHGC